MRDEAKQLCLILAQSSAFIFPPSSFRLGLRRGYYGGNIGTCIISSFVIAPPPGNARICAMNDSQSGPKMSTSAEPLPLPENIPSVQPGGGPVIGSSLPGGDGGGGGYAFSARLCQKDGRIAAGGLSRCAARDHRSAGPEVLPQCCRCSWAEAEIHSLAEIDSPRAVGRGRIGPHGWAALRPDDFGRRCRHGGISPCHRR